MQTSTPLNLIAPGVYLQDIPALPGKDLLTGVPVFLGTTEVNNTRKNGGASVPQMLTLWTQFGLYFGQPLPNGYLAHAVRGFFENGGRLCYVLPLEKNTPEGLQKGLEAIEALDAIDLVCAPDIVQKSPADADAIEMQRNLLEHCDRMGDRFAILDAFNIPNLEGIKALKLQQESLVGNNGAIYAPWLKIEHAPDPIPACGHIAGVYARCDRRFGVHRAPANYLLEGVLDLSLLFSDADWEILNPATGAGVNCIRSFRSRGIRVWGARTLSQNPQWQYVNIRRLKITVLRWAERNLADAIFEPNDSTLWGRLERELTVFCESLWRQGAMQGETVEEAFYVKCDGETNPPEVRNTGQVVTEIGLAPTAPSEFIVISLIHGSRGVKFNESDN